MKKFKKISLFLFYSILILGSVFAKKTKEVKVKIGVCGANNDHWKAVQYVLNQQQSGIKIELVEFSAYNLPNEALNSGDIDLNAFQHKAFLNNEIKANGYKIAEIGNTIIAPLTLYSKKYKSLEEIKKAAGLNGGKKVGPKALKFSVPSDGTNLSRGIKLLEAAGLIQVNPSAGYTPELKDITSYIYNVEVIPQSANTLPQTLNDYAGATINETYAIPAGLIPSRDGLLIEKQSEGHDNPYVNVIVAREKDKDNKVYKKIAEAFQSQIVAEYILGKFNEAFFPAFPYDNPSKEEAYESVKKVDKSIRL